MSISLTNFKETQLRYAKELYTNFIIQQRRFDDITKAILESLTPWRGNKASLGSVDYSDKEVVINYYYPCGDYEEINETISLDNFLTKSGPENAADIEERQRKEDEERRRQNQASYEANEKAELRRLQNKYNVA